MARFPFSIAGMPDGDGASRRLLSPDVIAGIDLTWAVAYWHRENVEAFSKGGHHKHGGKKWKRWSKRYARQQRRRKRRTILIDTGALRRGTELRAPKARSRGGVMRFTLGNTDRKAPFHQYGTEHVPQRKVLELTRKDIKKFSEATEDVMIKLGIADGDAIFGRRRKAEADRLIRETDREFGRREREEGR